MSQLDARQIALAALELVDRHGAGGFSIRAVARALGVTPMSLYYHVRDKQALAKLVVEASVAEHPMLPLTGDWRQDLWNTAQCSRGLMLGHPAVAKIQLLYNVWIAHSQELAARWMALWKEAGLRPEDALLAASASSAAIIGLIDEERRAGERDPLSDHPELPRSANADLLLRSDIDPDLRFRLGFDAILDGLLLRLAPGNSASGARAALPRAILQPIACGSGDPAGDG